MVGTHLSQQVYSLISYIQVRSFSRINIVEIASLLSRENSTVDKLSLSVQLQTPRNTQASAKTKKQPIAVSMSFVLGLSW